MDFALGGGGSMTYYQEDNRAMNIPQRFTMTDGVIVITCGTAGRPSQFGVYIGHLENGVLINDFSNFVSATLNGSVTYSNGVLEITFTGGTYSADNRTVVYGNQV